MTRARRILTSCAAIGLVAGLSACGINLRKEMGLVGEGPDEFAVVSRKPLTMPENGEALPVPQPGAASRVDYDPTAEAAAALGSAPLETADTGSAGETALLTGAAADNIDPEVRALLEAEAAAGSEDQLILDAWLGRTEEAQETLDPAAETRRIAAEAKQTKNPDLVVPEPPAED